MAKILVVEDEPNNVEIITRLLLRKGHEPVVAGSAQQAVAMAESERPALILMDITIPEAEGEMPHIEGGLNATRRIKAGAAPAVPILALSARSMPNEQQAMRDAGCDDVAMKPYDFAQLLGQIEALLDGILYLTNPRLQTIMDAPRETSNAQEATATDRQEEAADRDARRPEPLHDDGDVRRRGQGPRVR